MPPPDRVGRHVPHQLKERLCSPINFPPGSNKNYPHRSTYSCRRNVSTFIAQALPPHTWHVQTWSWSATTPITTLMPNRCYTNLFPRSPCNKLRHFWPLNVTIHISFAQYVCSGGSSIFHVTLPEMSIKPEVLATHNSAEPDPEIPPWVDRSRSVPKHGQVTSCLLEGHLWRLLSIMYDPHFFNFAIHCGDVSAPGLPRSKTYTRYRYLRSLH